jgi:hypothetical protein
MSDGHKIEDDLVITMTTEEFGQICKDVHKMFIDKCDEAKNKNKDHPTKKTKNEYVRCAKEAFVFSHLLELVDSMSNELNDSEQDEEYYDGLESIYCSSKKQYLN